MGWTDDVLPGAGVGAGGLGVCEAARNAGARDAADRGTLGHHLLPHHLQ